ncbi:hypothetical protein L227DRAFT_405198 [Lentinus tigrinus ALCF2SS1-6]|uniref:Vacuolar sorting protein Vps3844 C-terminal domain-containing protein n=1 Tax=Lentinus tigrinus ALCF2SS1-6 TaxID=1328759 RepID=A0A5C2RSQ9_9APHY|nr:hypothetical protein L227DRAFT_405198 [Lentinus tigrinus ALCF2SS1-6]
MKGLLIPLLLTGLCQAVRVYLHPDPHVLPRLPASKAGAVLSKHLALERFEDATPFVGEQELLVGSGLNTGVLLTISSEDVREVVPASMRTHSFSISSHPTHDSLSSLIPTYIDRAHHVYSYVHEKPSSDHGLQEVAHLKDFIQGDYTPDRFGAFDFTSLSKDARHVLHDLLTDLSEREDIKLAIVTVPSAGHHHGHKHHDKRQQPPQSPLPPPIPHPAEPIDSISTCFSTADACGNATSSCSGHGECVQASKAGKTCFVCACSATTDLKGRKEHWAGSACERKDVSGPFVLLAGTTVSLFLLVGGSVALLSGVGGAELPQILTGGSTHSR